MSEVKPCGYVIYSGSHAIGFCETKPTPGPGTSVKPVYDQLTYAAAKTMQPPVQTASVEAVAALIERLKSTSSAVLKPARPGRGLVERWVNNADALHRLCGEAADMLASLTAPTQGEPCDLCHGEGVNNAHQLWPGRIACRACNGAGVEPTPSSPVSSPASVEAVRAVLLEAREYAPRRDGIVGRIDAALASLTAPTQGAQPSAPPDERVLIDRVVKAYGLGRDTNDTCPYPSGTLERVAFTYGVDQRSTSNMASHAQASADRYRGQAEAQNERIEALKERLRKIADAAAYPPVSSQGKTL